MQSDTDDLFPDDYTPPAPRDDRPLIDRLADMTPEQRDQLQSSWKKPKRSRGKARTPENATRDNIERWFKQKNILYRRYNAGMMNVDNGDGTTRVIRLGDPGTSDYLALITIDINGVRIGVFAAIEVKAPGRLNTLTDLQEKFLATVYARGGIRIVATNAIDIENAIEAHRLSLITRFRTAFRP